MRVFVLLIALLGTAVADDAGLSGTVLAPDGTPVSGGRVVLVRSLSNRTTATIDRSGHFKQALESEGPLQVWILVPGLAPYRFNLIVPASRTVKLPPTRLSPATYFRAQFVTADGEAITSPTLRHQSLDANGRPIAVPDQSSVLADADGTVTIGPLPRGITMMAVDVPPFAQTRLSELTVAGKEGLVDAGVIAVQRGAVLQADIVDETGAPVTGHNVFLEDAAPRSLLSFPAAKTNAQGRATFDRLAAGRYRVSTLTKEGCGSRPLSITRLVSVGAGGEVHTKLVIGGSANLKFVSPLGPVMGRTVSASPDAGSSAPPWQWAMQTASLSSRRVIIPFPSAAPCSASTDADGRVTFKTFPPGAANIQLRLLNSTYVKRLPVPEGGREVALTIPDGLVSVHVANQRTNQPIANAKVVWTGNEARVEASTNGVGDALIEAAGMNGGRLSISAENFETLEANFAELPSSIQEVLLPPSPPSRVQLTVVGADGAPLPNAVVEFVPSDPIDVSDVAVTDAKGIVTFLDVPRGILRLLATAEGFVPAEVRVAEDARGSTTLTLKRVIE